MLRTYDRPCMRYEIGLCPAPCCGHADPKVYRETLAQVLAFLGGSTGPIVQVLTEKMMRYSEQMRYEQAAMMRDRFRALRAHRTSARLFHSLEDRDIVAMASCGLDRLAQVLYIRSGRLSGSEYFILDNPLEESTADLMRDFLLRHYDDGQMIPPEILLETPCSEMDTLAQLLSQTRGGKVRLHVPQRGEKHDQVLLAAKNAQENIEKHYLRQSRKYERTMGALKQLAGALGIPVPRRIECYDISNFQGDQSVASMVVFIDGEPAKKDTGILKSKRWRGQMILHRWRRSSPKAEQAEKSDAAFCDMPGMISSTAQRALAPPLSGAGVGLESCRIFSVWPSNLSGFTVRTKMTDHSEHLTSARHLLQRIRDEAHRFAITHHRAAAPEKTVHSAWKISGRWTGTAARAFGAFKSIRAVAQAT
jgi:excinuclease ABC subunit C